MRFEIYRIVRNIRSTKALFRWAQFPQFMLQYEGRVEKWAWLTASSTTSQSFFGLQLVHWKCVFANSSNWSHICTFELRWNLHPWSQSSRRSNRLLSCLRSEFLQFLIEVCVCVCAEHGLLDSKLFKSISCCKATSCSYSMTTVQVINRPQCWTQQLYWRLIDRSIWLPAVIRPPSHWPSITSSKLTPLYNYYFYYCYYYCYYYYYKWLWGVRCEPMLPKATKIYLPH